MFTQTLLPAISPQESNCNFAIRYSLMHLHTHTYIHTYIHIPIATLILITVNNTNRDNDNSNIDIYRTSSNTCNTLITSKFKNNAQ